MIKTLRQKLLITLLGFTSVTILFILLLYFYVQKKEKQYSQFINAVESTNTLILKDVTILRDFFENETINSEFFKTKKSQVLKSHENQSILINRSISNIDSLQTLNSFTINAEISSLRTTYLTYNRLINDIVENILKRGFKDYGLEGEMRVFAHKLEDYQNEIGLVNILQLRRHEKDFIIRQENEYILKHRRLITAISEKISKNKQLSKLQKTEILRLLKNYEQLFINLTDYDKKIGIKNSIGLKQEIDFQVIKLENQLQVTISKSYLQEKKALDRLKIIFLLALGAAVLLSITVAAFISKKITSSVIELKEKISEFVAGDFSKQNIIPIKDARYEIDSLANNFSLMERHILNQMNALRNSKNELATLIGKASKDIKKPLLEIKTIYDEATRSFIYDDTPSSIHQLDKSWNKILTIVDELTTVKEIMVEEIMIEKINLEPLIRSVYFEFKHLPQFESIVFSISLSFKEEFYSSKELIRLIFYHLFENSIKYSKSRNGFSFINVKIENLDRYMIKVIVKDNGIGIKKEDQAHIFEMFYRTSNKMDGTGLGLYIVQNSLEKINGWISLESDENSGTSFTLILPNKKHIMPHKSSVNTLDFAELSTV